MNTQHSQADYFPTIDSEAGNRLLSWSESSPGCAVLALVAESSSACIPKLQSLCTINGITLLGAVFPELLVNSQFHREGIWIFKLETPPAYCIIDQLTSVKAGNPQVIEQIAKLARANQSSQTLLLIFDGMVPTIESWLTSLYKQLGRTVHYLGVNAGSETFKPMPCLFDNKSIKQDAVLVASLPYITGGILAHGYTAPEKTLIATSSKGNRIVSIDWRPAFEVYAELAREEYSTEITPENFYQYGAHFPFGIIRATGEVQVRIPVAMETDGSVFCVGQIPENAILTLLRAENAQSAANEITQHLKNSSYDFLLTFFCAGRRMHSVDRALSELEELATLNRSALAGALSLGEIGSSSFDSYPLFHNATIVCAPWNEN